ncbi:MBL fold metallo-hydrolase [Skermania piniformis]|uniref:MBL fold metallo-hydrolase n=1 Tax=Skermania pinensis TaxID=39122 RepID=A0ABX8S424_9ACTN|nr:MBL fold metallo-hydrolase [Skermania piniformis]QXQ12554.1 MBL fold metallo-hydrolase [Skermania piniformis]
MSKQQGKRAPVPIDAYTGHVSPGSAAQRRELPGATVYKMSVGPMDNNAYLVRCSGTGQALLIDAANEGPRLRRLIAQETPGLARILTTHRHADHWQALAEVTAATGVPTTAHRLDAAELPVSPDVELTDGDQLQVGDRTLEVIHLVGHTPGSIALALTDDAGGVHLFTGDSLFPGGVGRTTSSADFTRLLDDVSTKLFDRYPDHAVVYPGHGDDTTLGAERPHLAEWRARGW